jgi:aminopeptidase N
MGDTNGWLCKESLFSYRVSFDLASLSFVSSVTGLTVFRDQEFSGDLNSKAVKRIEDVRTLRARQFSEDAGPMAHPIRPGTFSFESPLFGVYTCPHTFSTTSVHRVLRGHGQLLHRYRYVEPGLGVTRHRHTLARHISPTICFASTLHTVYCKGAEIIRMYQTILSTEGFNKGMKLYFERHDGQAVTCDDFLSAMADANSADLSQFALWYSTPGTPTVTYEHSFEKGVYTLTLSQSSQSDAPMHIPVAIGLLDKETGKEVVETTVLDLKEESQTFTFDGLDGAVVPSLLRTFSAPIKLVPAVGEVDQEELAFLAARDTDGFNRCKYIPTNPLATLPSWYLTLSPT